MTADLLSTDKRPRVAVVDDATQTRDTFAQTYTALDVACTYANVEALLAVKPVVDLVVLDLLLATTSDGQGVLQGPRAIKELARLGYQICLYSDERRPLVLAHCFASGATGLARKIASREVNQETFLSVAHGQTVVPDTLIGLTELLARYDRLPELTPPQAEVLTARARGESWDAIARRLHITPKTAQERWPAIMAKMVHVLHETGLHPDASPADVERALGLAPGDLNDPNAGS